MCLCTVITLCLFNMSLIEVNTNAHIKTAGNPTTIGPARGGGDHFPFDNCCYLLIVMILEGVLSNNLLTRQCSFNLLLGKQLSLCHVMDAKM